MASLNDVSRKAGTTDLVTRSVLDAIVALTREGQDVRVQNFGTFSKQHKDAYTGRNPGTGEEVAVEAKDVLKFKCTKGLDMSTPKAAAPARRR